MAGFLLKLCTIDHDVDHDHDDAIYWVVVALENKLGFACNQ